jgi:hypothetical protein
MSVCRRHALYYSTDASANLRLPAGLVISYHESKQKRKMDIILPWSLFVRVIRHDDVFPVEEKEEIVPGHDSNLRS